MENYQTINPMAYNFSDFYRKWSITHSLINIIFFGIVLVTGNTYLWITASLFSFSYFVYLMPSFTPALPLKVGYANIVTISRLSLLILMAFVYNMLGDIFLFISFLVIIILDGVDGFIARRLHQTSDVGECLDMETDAFLVLVLGWVHFSAGRLDYWIIVPGISKYIYTITFGLLQQKDYPSKKIRATIAVIFFFSLTTPFIFTENIFTPICFVASLLVMMSFGLSIISSCVNVYRRYRQSR